MSYLSGPGVDAPAAIARMGVSEHNPIVVQKVPGQSGPLLQCIDMDGVTILAQINSDGSISGGASLSGTVILAPGVAGRNTIQPVMDGVEAINFKQASQVNPGPLWQLLGPGGIPQTMVDGFGDLIVFPNGMVNQIFEVIDPGVQSDLLNVFRAGTVNHKVVEISIQNDADVGLTIKANSATQSAALLTIVDDTNSPVLQVFASSGGGKKIGLFGSTAVARQTGASAAGIAAIVDVNAKAAVSALQIALANLGAITSPA